MQRISEYSGKLLNHFEAVYRPGERQLAQKFLTALGLHINDFGFSAPEATQMMGIHFEADDLDPTNNIIFLHQMSEPQAEFDTLLRNRLASDPELAGAQAKFLERVEKYPGGTPHFGIRYRSMEALDEVVDRLVAAGDDLRPRVKVTEMPPYAARPGMPDIRQVFVQSDVISTSPAGFGQTIELQADRAT